MESGYGEGPSPLEVVTSINEASLLATAKCGETAALDTLYRAHAEEVLCIVHRITRNRACFDYPRADRHRSRHSGRLPAEHLV